MEASGKARRQRYGRATEYALSSLTTDHRLLLEAVAEMGFLSTSQLIALAPHLSTTSVRRRARELFDTGLFDLLPLSPDPAIGGSAVNVYALSRRGAALLQGEGALPPRRPLHGTRSAAFLAHELSVRDAYVALTLAARANAGLTLLRWEDGQRAAISLPPASPQRWLRPDAWFAFEVGPTPPRAACLEVDRGSERLSGPRWAEKLATYAAGFQSGAIEAATKAPTRLLITAPTEERLRALSTYLAERGEAPLARLSALCLHGDLRDRGPAFLIAPIWRRAGQEEPFALTPADPTVGPGGTNDESASI